MILTIYFLQGKKAEEVRDILGHLSLSWYPFLHFLLERLRGYGSS